MTKKNKRNNNGSPQWSAVLRSPFTTTSCHIPDDQTMDAGVVSSKYFINFSPNTINGSSSSTHNSGLVLLPHPTFALYTLYETAAGSGILSDLNASGTAYNGTSGGVPNLAAISPNGARIRCSGMGVRVTYEGTELNRSGRYFAGLCPIQGAAQTTTTTGTVLSPLSTICQSYNSSLQNMKQCMVNMSSARVADGTFEYNWFPNGVPTFQATSSSGAGYNPYSTPAGVSPVINSAFNSPYGTAGVQSGQNALVFFVENDTTSVLQSYGNTFSVEMIWHWEVIPVSPYSVAFDLTPSKSNYSALQAALNSSRLRLGGMSHDAMITSAGRVSTVNVNYNPNVVSTIKSAGRKAVNAANTAWGNLPPSAKKAIVSSLGGAASHMAKTYIMSPADRRRVGM